MMFTLMIRRWKKNALYVILALILCRFFVASFSHSFALFCRFLPVLTAESLSIEAFEHAPLPPNEKRRRAADGGAQPVGALHTSFLLTFTLPLISEVHCCIAFLQGSCFPSFDVCKPLDNVKKTSGFFFFFFFKFYLKFYIFLLCGKSAAKQTLAYFKLLLKCKAVFYSTKLL